ncbi:MAG: hypothetical protein ACRD0P_24965, partial [Stackebrandtia sp.]
MNARRRIRRLLPESDGVAALVIRVRHRLTHQWDTRPRQSIVAGAATGLLLGAAIAGPIAAGVTAGYTAYGGWAWRRHRVERSVRDLRRATVHRVGLMAADLRAGAAPATVLAALPPDALTTDPVCRRVHRRLAAVRVISERTGAPAAQLLHDLAGDLKAGARTEALVATATAGATASAR